MFSDEGAVVVASTYTKVGGTYDFGFRHDPDDPLGTHGRLLRRLLHQPQPPDPGRHAGELHPRVPGRRLPDQLGQVVQLLLRRPADDAARGRAAHRYPGRVHRVRPGRPALLLRRQHQEPAGELPPDARRAPAGAHAHEVRRRHRSRVDHDQGGGARRRTGAILGRGITNSRSNYDLAARWRARRRSSRPASGSCGGRWRRPPGPRSLERLLRAFRLSQTPGPARPPARAHRRPRSTGRWPRRCARPRAEPVDGDLRPHPTRGGGALRRPPTPRRAPTSSATPPARPTCASPRSVADPGGASFDLLRRPVRQVHHPGRERAARARLPRTTSASAARSGSADPPAVRAAVEARGRPPSSRSSTTVGTGYGRARLPFPKEQIRSEILCHGLGAHALFPGHAHRARHRRSGHQGDPGRRRRHRHQLPDERPLRGRLRPLPRLHRRRDEHRPARARTARRAEHAAGARSTPPAPSSPGPSCASGCRSARGARTSSPASIGPIILRAMRLLARSGGIQRRVHLHRRGGAQPGRGHRRCASCARRTTASARSTSPPTASTPARSAPRSSPSGSAAHDRHRRDRRRLRRGQGGGHGVRGRRAPDPRPDRVPHPPARRRRRSSRRCSAPPCEAAGGRRPRLRRHHRRGRGRAVRHRPLLRHDDPRPGRRSSSSRGRGRCSTSGALHSRAVLMDDRGKVLELQDDQPVRLGLRPVPREHRPLPRRLAGGDRRALAAGRRPGEGQLDLRGAGRDRRHQHGLARDHAPPTSCAASTRAWRGASRGCCARSGSRAWCS